MPNCENIAGCSFFNDQMKGQDTIKEMLKKRFCQGDNSNCARYLVCKKLGKTYVPADLIPNQFDRAKQIISKS